MGSISLGSHGTGGNNRVALGNLTKGKAPTIGRGIMNMHGTTMAGINTEEEDALGRAKSAWKDKQPFLDAMAAQRARGAFERGGGQGGRGGLSQTRLGTAGATSALKHAEGEQGYLKGKQDIVSDMAQRRLNEKKNFMGQMYDWMQQEENYKTEAMDMMLMSGDYEGVMKALKQGGF